MVHSYRSIILINDVSHRLNCCVSSENGMWDLIGFAGILYNVFAKKSRSIFEERRERGARCVGRSALGELGWGTGMSLRGGWDTIVIPRPIHLVSVFL